MVNEHLSRSTDETRSIGKQFAAALKPGMVVSLTGDLGAGKTTLVQGMAEAFGITEPVVSPTFVIVAEYRGTSITLFHSDLYRLDTPKEIENLALPELLDQGVLVVEWGERWLSQWPDPDFRVTLEVVDPATRKIVIDKKGERS